MEGDRRFGRLFAQGPPSERRALLVLLMLGNLAMALFVVQKFQWARPINGGPQARSDQTLSLFVVPFIACIIGFMGSNLRYWLVLHVISNFIASLSAFEFIRSDDGTFRVWPWYSEKMLEVHLVGGAMGVLALVLVIARGPPAPGIAAAPRRRRNWKPITAALLVPAWLLTSLALSN